MSVARSRCFLGGEPAAGGQAEPDAGAHVQDGAHALRSQGRQVVIAQGAIERVVLLVEPLVFQRIFGQERGDVLQVVALDVGPGPPWGRQRRHGGGRSGAVAAAASQEHA
jgi:hypothetical protein